MAGNLWTEEEIMERARTGKIQISQFTKTTLLNQAQHCTLSCTQMTNPKGFPLHLHEHHDEVIIILEGEGEVVVGDQHHVLKKGGVYFVPRGTPHTPRMNCLLLSIYSPTFDLQNPDRIILE